MNKKLIDRPSQLLGQALRMYLAAPKVTREEGQLAPFQQWKDAMVTVVDKNVTGLDGLAPHEPAE